MKSLQRNIFLFIILFLMSGKITTAQDMQVLDQVVAVVDNEVILLSQLRQQAFTYAMQYGINPQTQVTKFNELMKQVLDNLVVQKVLYIKALEDSVFVEDRVVENELEQRIQMLVQQYGSREKVREYFGAPIESIKRDFAEEARQGMMAKMVMGQREQLIKITRREVIQFYNTMKDSLPNLPESYHIANILLKIKPGEVAVKRARERIENILYKIKEEGADFAEMAREFSDDPGSAANGGELGFFERGEMVREFEEVAYQLKPGEISEIVRTDFGFHIIQLIERQGEKINCRHLLAAIEPTIDDERNCVAQIKEIYDNLKQGQKIDDTDQSVKPVTFEEMVEQYSDDLTSKENHGDLGWWEKDMIQPKEFAWVLADLEPGEISEPVKTKLGYHILKLLEKDEPRPLDIEKDWERIENFALQMKKQEELQKWIAKLKEKVYINVKEVTLN